MEISAELIHLTITVVFSFLIGMEIKTYHMKIEDTSPKFIFGTARTFTFIGILGYFSYKFEPVHFTIYAAILLSLSLLYALLYTQQLKEGKQGILLYTVMLCVYAFGPMTELFPLWMSALLFVLIVFILNADQTLYRFSNDINMEEFETLGKMVLLSAVILPLLPDSKVIPYLPISSFELWMAVVVISGISYGGYLIQKYLFPSKGYFLTGIFGGTYSSTATTVVLARKVKDRGNDPVITAAIIAATSMMYLRLVVVALVFNLKIAMALALPFVLLAFAGLIISFIYLKQGNQNHVNPDFVDKNPLELGTAFLFAILFAVMMLITSFVMDHYGSNGLQLLSFFVGFTDIDPFVLSLLTGKYTVENSHLVSAIMIAAGSNNILKSIYALWFGGFKGGRHAAFWVALMGVVTIGLGFWI